VTTIAELLIKLGVSVEGAKEAERELDGVRESAENVEDEGGSKLGSFAATAGKAFAAVGAAAVAASVGIFKMVDSITAAADETVKGAKAAGIQADEYQRLAFAAKISGTNTKALSIASRTISRGFNDAATKGTGPFVEGLELVGLRLEDIAELEFEDRLGVIADAINGLGSESEKLAASQLLLGARAGPQLATLIAEGSEGIKRLGDEAERTGGVLSDEALKSAADFQDEMTRLRTTLGGVANEIGLELAPVVQDIIAQVKDWTLQNKGLIATRVKDFVRGVIPVIKTLAEIFGTVIGAVRDFIELIGGVKPALGVAASAMVAFKLATAGALGPVGAIGLALTSLVSIVAGLIQKFDLFNDELSETAQRASRIRETQRELAGATEQAEQGVERTRRVIEEIERERVERRERVTTAAEQRSSTASRTFAERQRAGARVREQLESKGIRGRRADQLVQDVILGRQTEEEALQPRKRGGGGRRAKRVEEQPESDVTLAEALLAVRTGTADPKQLKKVVQQLARKTPSTKAIKPTVAIDFFNFQITQNFRGQNAAQMGRESAMAIRGEFEKQTARAAQAIPGSVVR